jgi:flagellar biosynthesis/type III secretory pathway M-ring protein FliF/YscJ
MDPFKKLVESLSLRQRVMILAAATAVVAGLVFFTHWHRESDFRPLYTSLAAEDAAAVVEKLKQSGVEYRLSDNGATVLVASARAPSRAWRWPQRGCQRAAVSASSCSTRTT